METFSPKGKINGIILPTFILDKKITFGAKILYALLCNYAGSKDHCWPCHATLAERLSCSSSSVKSYIKELQSLKLIEIRRARYRSSTYYLLSPFGEAALPSSSSSSSPDGQEPTPVTASGASGATGATLASPSSSSELASQESTSGYQESTSGYLNNLTNLSKNTPPPPTDIGNGRIPQKGKEGGAYDSGFEKIYAFYPRKDARERAHRVWKRFCREGVLPELNILKRAIEQQCNSDMWKKENGRFIPYLCNWLLDKNWQFCAINQDIESNKNDNAQQIAINKTVERISSQIEMNTHNTDTKINFAKFASHFPDGSKKHGPAFGLWSLLVKKGKAPCLEDITNNGLSIMNYLHEYKYAHGL